MFRHLISHGLLRRMSLLAIGILSATQAFSAPPDLTSGGLPDTIRTTNLGPTGMRGWVYHTNNGTRGDTSESRQIQVQIVGAGSPAAGILFAGDVILGANGTGANPVAFSSDARKSLANAINDAEARTPATLKLLVWRAGTTSTMTITLRTMGTYSATAPYNCPKSAKILEEGLQYIMTSETAGSYSFGTLSLLAANNPADPNNAARMARAQTEARALVPDAATQAQLMTQLGAVPGKVTWDRGHMLVFLAEYFLLTGDTVVLPAIRAFAVNIARNQSLFGTMGHGFAEPWPDGSPNGPMAGFYGAVNNASMPCFLGVLLAKECGITDPEIDPAIAASSRFLAYYAHKGVIPYGEHEPGFSGHESNGKMGLAALAFKLQPNRTAEARYYTQMATAAASEREIGHNGAYFNYLWSPLGAAAGGEQAAAAHFATIRWMLDLNRKWDGSFDYDCLNAEGPNSGANAASYHSFRMSTAALLVYALPLRQLHITGRGANSAHWLTSAEVAAAVAADTYDPATRSISQLVSDLGNWSPDVQHAAAGRLATLPIDSTTVNQLIALATDANGTSRVGACIVLGKSTETSLVSSRAATLASLLTDPQPGVRYMAAESMRHLSTTEKNVHRDTILSAAASTATSLLPLDEQDPLHLAHARLAMLLFYGGTAYGPTGFLAGSNVTSAPKNLLYPAIKAVARTPIGQARSTLYSIYPHLTQADLLAVSDAVVDVVSERAPADRMFSGSARLGGLEVLQKYGIAEGVPLSLKFMTDDFRSNDSVLALLELYAGSCNTVTPVPDVDAFCLNLIRRKMNITPAQEVLAAIAADTNPATITPLKSIQSVIADNPTLTLPNNWTTLRTTSTDLANGASIYTWRKVHGAGNVFFSQNGTAAGKNTVVLFDGTPGQYLFEVKMSDSRGLTELTSTVAVTLYQTGGTLPPNSPPVANNQSPTLPQAITTPIVLTGSDPEGLPLLYTVLSQPSNGKLTGSAPNLGYISNYGYNGPDSFTFRVTDSEGQISNATVNITVTANNVFPTAIYAPFNYPAGALNGASGASEVGFSGAWTAHTTTMVAATSLAYGSLPVLGGSVGVNNSWHYASKRAISTSALAAKGLLNDGATLWFSLVNGYQSTGTRGQSRLAFALANSGFGTGGTSQYFIANEGPQLGVGLGVTLGRFSDLDGSVDGKNVATLFRDSSFPGGPLGFDGNIFGTVPFSNIALLELGEQRLVVGKITWGAASDTIELYEPSSNLKLGPVTSTLTVNVDQSTFDTITFIRGEAVTLDEVRFGANYTSVMFGNAPMTADTTAPVSSPLAFSQVPAVTSPGSISMVAHTAYDPSEVEYYFTCTAGGGHHSGWQSSPSYTDTGLTPGVLYSYTVKARDKSPARNETAPSAAKSATMPTQATLPTFVGMQQSAAESIIANLGMTVGGITLVYGSVEPVGTVLGQTPAGGQSQPLGTAVNLTVVGLDVIAPAPNPATFAVAPVAVNSSSITMTATTGVDPSGVQYLFTESSGNPGASSSAWQDSPVFTDTGLTAATNYTYTVTLRDKSPAANATAASSPSSATTNSIPAAQLWYWDGGTADILTNGNGASAGGSGTWNTALRNWDGGNVAHTEWNNSAGKTAVFGGTAGTVTIASGGVTVGDMQLTSATYTITGAPITITGTSNLQINVAANIQSVLTGNFGLTKTGTGTLTLSAINTYTGTTTVSGGVLAGSITNFLPTNSNVNINTGGTFRYAAAGNFNAHNLALNGGTLSLDGGNSTFGTLAVNANSTIDGASSNFQTNTINASITGVGGLTKSGGGTVRLYGVTNDYSGPTTINAGALLVKSSLYGNNTSLWIPANITVANNTIFSLNVGAAGEFTAGQAAIMFTNLTTNVNNNGMRPGSFMCVDTRNAPAGTTTYSGILADSTGTGGGAVNFKFFGSSTTALELTGANTYTGLTMLENNGTLRVSSLNSVATNAGLGTVHSASSNLGAPTTVANGTIWLGAGGYSGNTHPGTTYNGATLTYIGTGETTDRVLNIGGANNSTCRIDQSGTGLMKFVSNITATETRGPKNFILQGSTTGQGEFAGVIPNVQTTAPLTLTKSGTGTWTLSAANQFTGITTLSGGSLVLTNANALSGGIGSTGGLGAITFNGGVIGLGVGDFARPLAAAGTIGAATFTGAGGWAAYGANRAVNLGGASAAITWATAGTGLNSQILILGNQTATHAVDFKNPLNLGNAARTVRVDDGTAPVDGILSGVLSGTGGGLTKTGFGTLVLSNSNTYTGTTSVNQGTLLIEGNNSAATGAITVAAGANLGGKGTLGGNLTISTGSGLSFDLNAPAAGHDRLDLVSGKALTFTGATTITITSPGGAAPGTYTLFSGGGNIFYTVLPSLVMPQGWNATLSISGNQLLLTVTSVVNDAPVWAANPVVGANASEDQAYSGTLAGSASDVDPGDILTFAKLSGPSWLAVAANGALSGTPPSGSAGINPFSVSVSDGIAPAVNATLNINVIASKLALANSYVTSLDLSFPLKLLPAGGFPSFMVGPITGSSTLTNTGGFTQTSGANGIVSFTNNGAGNTFSGNIIVDSGTLRIAGSPFASNGGFTAPGMTSSNTISISRAGFLNIDDFATGTGGYTANRFGSGGSRPAVNLAGGTLLLNGLNNASSSAQTFGALISSSGAGSINVTRNTAGTPTLTFSSLAINSGSLLSFNGTALGTGTSDSRITFTSAPTLNDGILVGARFATTGGDSAATFVTYGANGVRAFTTTDFTDYVTDINAATATQNVRITSPTAVAAALTANRTVNSLNYAANGGTWSLGGFKLTIDSGMLLRNGTNAAITIDTGTLTAGNGIDDIDLNVITAQQNMTINAVIADNASSAVTLVKSGDTRSLTLGGTANSTYTGGTYVVGGDLITGNVANRIYLGTGKVTVDGASFLNLQAIGATSNATGNDFTAINGGKIQISNNNHGSVDTFNIAANSIIAGVSTSTTQGLASLTRGTNVTLAPGAIIGHSALTAALSTTTGTIQNLGTAADLYYGLNANQTNAAGALTIGNGTAFKGISTDRSDRSWEQGTINIAAATTSVDFQGHATLPNAVQLTLGNGTSAGGPVITLAGTGTLDIRAIGRLQLNDTAAVYGNTGSSKNVRFVSTPGSTLRVEQAAGMGSGAGIASALIQNGGTLVINNSAALNGAVTVQAGGQFNANQTSLTGAGALTFNEGSIILIGNATGFSGTQATSATINPGTLVRSASGSFGAASTTLDSILGSGAKHVSYITQGNDAANPTTPNTAVYTLNKSSLGKGGVLTNDQVVGRTVGALANGNITLGANGGVIAATTNSTLVISENITGNGALTIGTTSIIDGMPKLGTVSLNSANDYIGGTIIDAGTLYINNGTTPLGPTSGTLTVNGGTVDLGANSLTVGNLTGTGGVIKATTGVNRTLTIGQGDNGGGNYQGSIQNGVSTMTILTKTGTGTITLSGANAYTGATAINAGKLIINGNQGTASGNVTVAANATLGGSGTLGGNTTIAAGGKLEFNLSTSAASYDPLNISSGKSFGFSGASELVITSAGGATTGVYTLVTGGNNITGSAPATLSLPAGWAATVSISGNSLLLNVTSTGGMAAPQQFLVTGHGTTSSGFTGSDLSSGTTTGGTTDETQQATEASLPLPWTSTDIGTGMLAGSTSHNAGTFTQAGSGVIGSTSDKLRFTYQTLTGDGEIIAKISALQNTGTAARVGVMIRDTLATNSKQIFMGLHGSSGYRWARRTATGGSTSTSNTNSSSGTVPNTWVRLVRSGTTITAYKSTNGTSWTTVGSTTNTTFSSTCYIGLAVGSGSDTTLNTSQFGNVSVTP